MVHPKVLRHAAAGGELAAPLAQVGEAHDRVDEIVVGRELERVDARVGERRAQLLLARLAAAAKRLRKPLSCVSTKSCSPVSASWMTSRPRSGSSISSGSYRRTATTSWRCASWASGSAQPGALMKSDTTNTSERRGAIA